MSHKRCKVRVEMLTRALSEGDTAIVTVILGHKRLKEMLKSRARVTVEEYIESGRFEIEHSPERNVVNISDVREVLSTFEVAVRYQRYYAVDRLYEVEQQKALETLYKRIKVDKDNDF